jgi:CRISPR-associated protein Cas2
LEPYLERFKRLRVAGLWRGNPGGYFMPPQNAATPEIVAAILTFMGRSKTNHNRTYMAMYDITSNKVRRLVARYFEEKGFLRVQKSVYLASLSTKQYRKIADDIADMNALYENADSIIFMPLNDQIIAESRFIGKELDFQLATQPPSSIVF